ncbi:ATP-dependent DNA helicase PIF1 [Coprinopsis cinerea AmutBmut pab1-1]|nr:ATP-dependent DNA helicase PIF1 [Coprinopsis cinerea AmutBmut pab1-1]
MQSDFQCENTRRWLNGFDNVESVLKSLGEPHPGSLLGPLLQDYGLRDFKEEMKRHTDRLLLRYNLHKHRATCWKYLNPKEPRSDANCRFGMDGVITARTEIEEDTGRINVKRLNGQMTHYTPLVTFLAKCNHDVKFIGSGKDAKAFMYYVTEYITKSPITVHAGLAALSYAIRQTERRFTPSTNTLTKPEVVSAMTTAVNSMLGHQEVSHQQVMRDIIVGGPERYTNAVFQTFNWGECLRFVNITHEFREKGIDVPHDPTLDSAINEASGGFVSVTPQSDDVSISSGRLDYVYRSSSSKIGRMGLYTFLASTRKERIKRNDDGDIVHRENRFLFSAAHPQVRSHLLVLRRHSVVPVLLGPNLARSNALDDQDNGWCRDMIILFKPWRNPLDLKEKEESWVESWAKWKPKLGSEELSIIENMAQLAEGKELGPRHKRDRAQADGAGGFRDIGREVEENQTIHSVAFYESNAYKETSSEELQEIQEVPSGYKLTLETLLGCDNANALSKCYPNDVEGRSTVEETLLRSDSGNGMELKELDEGLKSIVEQHENALKHRGGGSLVSDPDIDMDEEIWEGHLRLPAVTIVSAEALDTRPFGIRTVPAEDPRREVVAKIVSDLQLHDNPEQLRAFRIVSHHVLAGGAQLLMYVGGSGGTGKSHIIKAIVTLFKALGRFSELLIGAPTGIAATLIGGTTLHSLLMVGTSSKAQINPDSTKLGVLSNT